MLNVANVYWLKNIYVELRTLRTLVLAVTAHPYCARKFTRHVMHRACALITKIGQMTFAIALLGDNDLGRSVIPTFLSRNRFIYNYLHIFQK